MRALICVISVGVKSRPQYRIMMYLSVLTIFPGGPYPFPKEENVIILQEPSHDLQRRR